MVPHIFMALYQIGMTLARFSKTSDIILSHDFHNKRLNYWKRAPSASEQCSIRPPEHQ